MNVALIAALARNRVIGRGGTLPWHLPEDLRRFRRRTMGHFLLVGRRTFAAIGRPLPGRRMLVLSRVPGYAPPGVEVFRDLDQALARVAGEPLFVAGGGEVYAQTIGIADRLYLTLIDAEVAGDVHFPEIDLREWRQVEREKPEPPPAELAYEFVTYERASQDAS